VTAQARYGQRKGGESGRREEKGKPNYLSQQALFRQWTALESIGVSDEVLMRTSPGLGRGSTEKEESRRRHGREIEFSYSESQGDEY
jgi:hypothetical protein